MFSYALCSAQEVKPYSLEATYFYGSILKHSKDIASLITGHPEGIILSYNRKTYGINEWERRYNYPDWGLTFAFQDLKSEDLGDTYNLLAHYNFYFFNRKLKTRVAQGIGYSTNPFDITTNVANNAYGSTLFSATMFMLNYEQKITPTINVQAGFTFLHGSNGSIRSPNTSTNTLALHLGLLYQETATPEYIPRGPREKYSEPITFNAQLSTGLNESDYINLGQEPFLVLSVFGDKVLSKKSKILIGAEVFFSPFLKNEIEFLSVAFPQFGVTKDQDWKRVGVFIGHELRFNTMAFLAHVGYYAYYPYDFEGRFYERIGLRNYFGDHISASVAVKVHGAKAEAIEFGIGYRL